MVHFLDACICHGRKPNIHKGSSYHSRHDLLSRLIRRRDHIRVLVAPSLYGKTSLALEYAETVFSFENVFWIDGRSPCFLRDLDRNLIMPVLLKSCERGGLLIIDDLPELDSQRQTLFKDLLLGFLKLEWEVLISSLPSNDPFDEGGLPIMKIQHHDFLIPETLIDAYRLPAERFQRPVDLFTEEERIAGLFWSQDRSFDALLDELLIDDLPDELILMMFIVLCLEQGSFEDIHAFLGTPDRVFNIDLLGAYVHLGIDPYQRVFRARSFDVASLTQSFLPLLSQVASCSRFTTGNMLVSRLADVLLGKGNPQRACELIAHMTTLEQRRKWLVERSEHLIDQSCFLSAQKIYEEFRSFKDDYHLPLMIGSAERLMILGEETEAIAVLTRVLKAQDARDEVRAQAILLLIMMCTGRKREEAYLQIKKLAFLAGVFDESRIENLIISKKEEVYSEWKIRSVLEIYLCDQTEKLIDFLEYCRRLGSRPRLLSQLLVRVTSLIVREQNLRSEERKFTTLIDPLLEMAYEHMLFIEHRGLFSYQDAMLIRNMESLQSSALREAYDMLPMILKEKAHAVEMKLFSQRKDFELIRKSQYKKGPEGSSPQGMGPLRREEEINHAIPTISIQLFGGLVVKREGRELDLSLFSRQKVKALLTMLAIDQGKEIPRDRLARILWPESAPLAAQKNLHSTWSLLRKAFRTEQGSCPYLTRTQFSYKLEESFVLSDVAAFKDLCRSVLFEVNEATDWLSINTRFSEIYRGDLLPTESENEAIIKARNDYRSRLVDCCSAAAFRLHEEGEHEMAMWFSQMAIEHDQTREDAYLLLMKTQVALGQRTAALDTYFSCCRHLSEELGIDPGVGTKVLYQEIIMAEEYPRKPRGNDAIDAL